MYMVKSKARPCLPNSVCRRDKVTSLTNGSFWRINLGQISSNDEHVWFHFRFEEPTPIATKERNLSLEVNKMSQHWAERKILTSPASWKLYWNHHEDWIDHQTDGIWTCSEKVKVGDVVFPGDVLADLLERIIDPPVLQCPISDYTTEKDGG